MHCGIFYDLYPKTTLCLAVQLDNADIVKLFILNDKLDIYHKVYHNVVDCTAPSGKYYNTFFTERTAFNLAVQRDNVEIAKLLLENENLDIIIFDMEKGIECTTDDYQFIIYYNTAFNYAVERENIEMVFKKKKKKNWTS